MLLKSTRMSKSLLHLNSCALGDFYRKSVKFIIAIFRFDESIRVRTALFGADSTYVAQVDYSKDVALLFCGDFNWQ